jgi:hypothetical protein
VKDGLKRVVELKWKEPIMNTQETMRLKIFLIALLATFLVSGSSGWTSEEVDHSLYAELLETYVEASVVDYQGFKNEEAKLDQYLKVLESVNTKDLSRNQQFAFYVNAYNAWTIKLILSGYPGIKSIKDLGSFLKSPWKKKICRIDGDVITLDDIEHNILRPRFQDPRVHFAINCASKGCPPLRSQPYLGSVLDQQLDEMVTAFINDPKRTRLEGRTLYVSKIFDWFSEDFNDDVVGFVMKYAQGDLKKSLETQKGNTKVEYLDYDWSLNGK